MKNVEWGEYKLGDLFDIENTLSFNADMLTKGNEYDYVTRTSFNQGILQTTGFVNEENINSAGTWSLGLLQMDFFYRKKPWYAGQFIRKIIPKIKIPKSAVPFFTTILNKQKPILLSVLVRNVDNTFNNITVTLPTKDNQIDFDFMESFIAELEAERIAELSAYLSVSGLDNYELSDEERQAVEDLDKVEWGEYKVTDVFDVKNTRNILSRDIKENSGNIPYLGAGDGDNSVISYISYDMNMKENGDCIFIGGKTFVVTYQPCDFFSNDSHNLVLCVKDTSLKSKMCQLALVSCIYKGLKHQYSWGDSISNKKIQKDVIQLPQKNGQIDFEFMQTLISAIQKLVIKDVVLYTDKNIKTTEAVVSGK